MEKTDGSDVLLITPGLFPLSCPYQEIEPSSTEKKLAHTILATKGSGSSLLSVYQTDPRFGPQNDDGETCMIFSLSWILLEDPSQMLQG